MKNYRYFIATLMLAIAGAFQASAQVTETPYSRLGYGTLGDNATGIQRHMGGVGYAMQGGRAVNSKNPASYAATDSLTFIWDVGVDVSQVWSKEGDTKGNAFSGGLDYLSGVFRIAKNVGGSFGFIPYSSVSYSFNSDLANGSESRSGNGSISELYLGGAWSPVKGLSVGANFSYMFGTLEHSTAIVGTSTSVFYRMMEVRAFDLLGMDHKNIKAVTMPGFGTTDRTYDNAVSLIKCLNADFMEVSIRDAVNIHFRDIGQDPKVHDVTYENGQARERTQILMDIANKTGGMVIGTGDLSELALGWATYNGDHMSMYAVNASVPKTLVRHLVRYYADTFGDKELEAVLLDVLDTPVSPELLPPEDGKISQKTEDLVGPYELHDFYLYHMLRLGYAPAKIYRLAKIAFAGTYEDETILKWLKTFYRRFFAQQFKRSCLPDGPKVGSVAVSPRGDLRMPSDASARIWMEELEALSAGRR